ncbi:MAG: glycosyltransferase family 2 protein [Planctomycetota bacterium]
MTEIRVSVLMLAYNHEQFVAQAVESVLAQQFDEPWEIVIGEDCSTDGTLGILESYRNLHPDCIRVLAHERNLGPTENARLTLGACRGDYVAFLECDDFWTSPLKLKCQTACLEQYPECSSCAHGTIVVDTNGQLLSRKGIPERDKLSFSDVVFQQPFHTSSFFVRREVLDHQMRRIGWSHWPLDRALFLAVSLAGTVHMHQEYMSAYRIHAKGLWTSQDRAESLMHTMRLDERLARRLPTVPARLLRRSAGKVRLALLICNELRIPTTSTLALWLRVAWQSESWTIHLRPFLATTIKRFAPWLYPLARRCRNTIMIRRSKNAAPQFEHGAQQKS